MLIPRNKVVSAAMVASYSALAAHGVSVIFYPPQSILPYVGDPVLHWGIATLLGAIVALVGYMFQNRGRLLEAAGVGAVVYGLSIYLYGSASTLFAGDGLTRSPQATQLLAFIFFLLARAITLVVLYRRQSKAEVVLRAVATGGINSNGPA